MSGFVFINKVPGNFHISGHHYPEAVQRLYIAGHSLDFSHKINHLSFGDLGDIEHIEKNFGEKFKFELDGRDIDQSKFMPQGMMNFMGPSSLFVNYFLEISQVDYVDQTQTPTGPGEESQTFEAFRFRSSQTIKTEGGMPAIYFRYELSPIRIQYTMSLQGVSSFLVRVCAIVGGIYAVSSILESLIRNSLSIFSFGGATDPRQSAAMNDRTKNVEQSEQQGFDTRNVKYDELGNQIQGEQIEMGIRSNDI